MRAEWTGRFEAYRGEHPDLASELLRVMRGDLPAGWEDGLPDLRDGKADATRNSSGKMIQALAARIPELVGGSADLGSSNKTDISGAASLLPGTPDGRVMHFGVREHAMGGIMNGLAIHGGVRPFGGTFLIFSDYMRPSIRLAALSHLKVVYVFSHDSIGLGEDGPTHQPVEQLMALRAMPNLLDLRPADPAETAVAWKVAIAHPDGPAFLALTRQKVPALDRSTLASAEGLRRGGYVLADNGGGAPDVILIASGSEVQLALDARERLLESGTRARVVSLPSWALFRAQSPAYRDEVLPPEVTARVAVEAGTTFGWERWVGSAGVAVGLDHFGASAPDTVLYERFGITAEAVADCAEALLEAARGARAPA
jgi:transketolase